MRVAFTNEMILLLASGLLASCAVGTDYHKPEVNLREQFLGHASVAQRSTHETANLMSWWDGFDDPILTRLITIALDQNLEMAQASARIIQSRGSLRYANAALLPSGEISAQAAHSHQSLQTPIGQLLDATPGFDRNGEFYEADLGASWEIDVFGGLRRNREAARAEYASSEASAAAIRLAITAQTADTYIAIRGLQARVAIANQQVETQKQLLSTISLQYEKGVAAELQLHQAEGALSQVQSTVPALQAGLNAAMNSLDVLLGAQPGTYRGLLANPTGVPDAPGIADAGGTAELLQRRPDLIAAERRLAATNARIGVAMSEYYPKFSLNGLLGSATTTGGHMFDGGANQGQIGLGLRWRLFDFGRVDAEIAVAKGANAEALAAYRLSVLRATQDVEDAFSELVNRESQARSLASGESSLRKAREASFTAYQAGTVSLIEVLDSDRRLLETRDGYQQAKAEAARAAVASFRALGGGWNDSATDLRADR